PRRSAREPDVAPRRRLHPGGVRLWSGAERDREGGLQFWRIPEGTRISGYDPFTFGLEGNPQAAGTVERQVLSGLAPILFAATTCCGNNDILNTTPAGTRGFWRES